ncbi:DNA adenine methylase [Spirosoma areae]
MNLFGDVTGAKPFLKWAGGKRQLIPVIQEALPKNLDRIKNLTYVEPFIGGGAILFWLLQLYPNIRQAVINDINPDLTTAYRVIRDQHEDLIKALTAIQETYFSLGSDEDRRAFFTEKRAEFNTRNHEPVTNTTLLIFLNRTCFNGLYRVNSKNKFNVPFGRYERPQICDAATLRANRELLQRVEILTGDFTKTREYVHGEALFYFDPPYKPLNQTASFNSYASETFDDSSQERLAAFCRSIDQAGHLWLLSNSDMTNTDSGNSYFDELYSGFLIRRIKAKRNINSKGNQRGDINELLVSNYASEKLPQVAHQ